MADGDLYDPYVVDQVTVPTKKPKDKPDPKNRGGSQVLHSKKPEGAKLIKDAPTNSFGTGGKKEPKNNERRKSGR